MNINGTNWEPSNISKSIVVQKMILISCGNTHTHAHIYMSILGINKFQNLHHSISNKFAKNLWCSNKLAEKLLCNPSLISLGVHKTSTTYITQAKYCLLLSWLHCPSKFEQLAELVFILNNFL